MTVSVFTNVLSQMQDQDAGGKATFSQTEKMGLPQVRQGQISNYQENKGKVSIISMLPPHPLRRRRLSMDKGD
jgi:hypothetical protein